MGSEGSRTDESQAGSGETSNVVRIPRDWFGPPEELVPFGPRANQSPADPQSGFQPGAYAEDAEPGVPLDPNSFWGEEATSIHDVVEGSASDLRHPSEDLALRLGPFERVRRSARVGSVAVGVGLLVAVGVAVPLALSGSKPRAARRAVSSSGREKTAAVSARVARVRPAPRQTRRHGGPRPSRRSVRHHSHGAAAASPPRPTPVVYHPTQPTYSPQPSTGYTGTSGASSPASSGSASSGASGSATTVASSHSSQPAFGASGALGPMSSPDG